MLSVTAAMWIMLSLLWLLAGVIVGWMVRDARATALLERHIQLIAEVLLEQISPRAQEKALVRDTEKETSPEAIAETRISEFAIDGLARYIADQSGVSVAKARDEAMEMLGQISPVAQDAPVAVQETRDKW